jgi:voltage-gated potassium channel
VITRDKNGSVSFGRFDYVIQFLIIVSLIDFAFETLPDLSPVTYQILHGVEIFIIIIFTIEWLLRAALSRPSKSYIFSVFGLIDLLAILPFYICTGIDLRSIRAIRLLRLFRLLKLVRYSKAMQRYHRAFLIAKEELILFGFAALILFYLASVGIYYFEHEAQPEAFKSVFHSFWWATTTLTTVGYGDAYPVTIGGKVFTFFVLMIGLGFVAVPTGLFASALSAARKEEGEQAQHNH